MQWIARSDMDFSNTALEKRFRDAADQSVPACHFAEAEYHVARPEGLLGLILMRFAAQRAVFSLN